MAHFLRNLALLGLSLVGILEARAASDSLTIVRNGRPLATIAVAAGNAKAVNAAVLGALSARMGFGQALWEEALRRQIPARLHEVNLRAFALGREALAGGRSR